MNLDERKAQHMREEAAEAQRDILQEPRPMRLLFPEGGQLEQSAGWLARLYEGERMAREKKPGVYDHLRSAGPWFVSVDERPMSVLDGMSQTATVCAGFAEDAVVHAYVEGRFGDTSLRAQDTSLGGDPAVEQMADALRALCPGLEHVSFTNGGAEANEKAFALCRLNSPRPQAHRVLAFEGSFHGRTLLALHATWNPAKRGPFEFKGYEACFAPFPLWVDPMAGEPEAPEGYLEAAAQGDRAALEALARGGDALLAAEATSLLAADQALASGECFACVIEPMQSEGGDRYATARFFRALRLLTRHHDTPLIFDEVQTGFGLGGEFFWHQRFGLVDAQGQPDLPDAVVMAKRAQVGAVLSRFADPEPTSAHTASLVRGLVHIEMMTQSWQRGDAKALEDEITPRLYALAQKFPSLVAAPRASGFALAFDMPTAELRNHFINQRFWRGAIVFGAGDRTVRYRLSTTFQPYEVELLFDAMEKSLAWLEQHPGQAPPSWVDPQGTQARVGARPTIRYRIPGQDEEDETVHAIMELEKRIFEPARRDPEYRLRLAFSDADGVAVLAEVQEEGQWELAAYAMAAPLELMGDDQPWARHVATYGQNNTLYSMAISVAPRFQGLGLGRGIKAVQLRRARQMRRPDGSARYLFASGRNRVGMTDAMQRINRMFGAYEVETLTQQYGDPDGQAFYYHIPLGPLRPLHKQAPEAPVVDLAGTLSAPLAQAPASLVQLEEQGLLAGPTVTKITICNYITPAIVRSIEWICDQVPHLPHLYLTSGRDETVDKAVRTLRYSRKQASVAIGLEGGYLGHTSVSARSLSDPSLHREGSPIYPWPLVAHPAKAGVQASLSAIRQAVDEAGGPEAVLGLFIEPLQERTGLLIPEDFWPGLEALRQELDLPLIFVETASSYHRTGLGAFASASLPIEPDLMIWWGGGQQGFVHLKERYFISSPLTMVSTWDGDEISLIRIAHQLRASREMDLRPGIQALEAVLEDFAAQGMPSHGAGLYRVLEAGDRAASLAQALRERGARTRELPGGRLVIAPALDQAQDAARILGEIL